MKRKAFGYIRVSGQGQVEGDGLDRQEEAIRRYAKVNGIKVVEIFREKGVSGTIENRPALAELMLSLETNGHGVKAVVIEKLDRLARDLMVQEAIIRDFQRHGFHLISALEGPDLCGDDATRKLVRQIFGAIAEYDKAMLVAKLKAARERKRARDGKCGGRKGYHGTSEGKAIIRKIQELRRKPPKGERRTFREVAEALNSQGITTLTGKPWSVASVQMAVRKR